MLSQGSEQSEFRQFDPGEASTSELNVLQRVLLFGPAVFRPFSPQMCILRIAGLRLTVGRSSCGVPAPNRQRAGLEFNPVLRPRFGESRTIWDTTVEG